MPADPASMRSFECQIDHLICNEHGLYVHGWTKSEPLPVRGQLRLQLQGGRIELVDLTLNQPREDVAGVFPEWSSAMRSGFMGLVGSRGEAVERALLRFQLPHDVCQEVEIVSAGSSAVLARKRTFGHLIRSGIGLVASGKWAQLRARYRGFVAALRVARAAPWRDELERSLKGREVLVIVDHSMGGGANVARARTVHEWTCGRGVAIVLTFSVSEMQYVLEIHGCRGDVKRYKIQSPLALGRALQRVAVKQVVYNCAVSLPDVLGVVAMLKELVQRHGARMRVEVHDFFVVCPSPFLIDNLGTYCTVPAIERCRKCIAVHGDPYVSIAGERSIDNWRKGWGDILESASEVRCFSESSAAIVTRAYPKAAHSITVLPHVVTELRQVHVRRPPAEELVVGVVGAIGYHKGSAVIGGLVRAMEAEARPGRIIVIGSLNAECHSPRLFQTGPYSREDLPSLVERYGVNVALVPSIWPETFCFVAHEIVEMGLPLVTLDYGAQAELARAYRLGWVSSTSDGVELLALLRTAADSSDR